MKIAVIKYLSYNVCGVYGDYDGENTYKFINQSDVLDLTDEEVSCLQTHIATLNSKYDRKGQYVIVEIVDPIDIKEMVNEAVKIVTQQKKEQEERAEKRRLSIEKKKIKEAKLKKQKEWELYEKLKEQFKDMKKDIENRR